MQKTTFENIEAMQAYVGKEIALSEWLTIDQDSINQFGALTKDEQWIHCDPERAAKESPFKKTIAHGFMALSYLSYQIEECIEIKGLKMGLNYGFDKIRFISPVVVDSRIRARFNLMELAPKDEGFKLKYGVTIEIEGQEKPALVAEWLGMVFV